MTDQMLARHRHRGAVYALAIAALAALAFAFASALAASSASADPFCGGQTVNTSNWCYGAQRALSGDNAYGTSTSVCVGWDGIFLACSSGPGQIATATGASGVHAPVVRGNAASFTTAYGNTF